MLNPAIRINQKCRRFNKLTVAVFLYGFEALFFAKISDFLHLCTLTISPILKSHIMWHHIAVFKNIFY